MTESNIKITTAGQGTAGGAGQGTGAAGAAPISGGAAPGSGSAAAGAGGSGAAGASQGTPGAGHEGGMGFSPAQKATVTYDDFAKLDFRVAVVKHAEFHPNADRLLKVQLDDGTPGGRQVCAGIKQWYDPASLIGKRVIIVANLAERKIRGEISQGMILAASDLKMMGGADDPNGRDVIVLTTDKPAKPGSVVS